MIVSTYGFLSYEERECASTKIYNNCGGHPAYDDSRSVTYDGMYILHILSDCTDVSLAAKICQGNGGKIIDW